MKKTLIFIIAFTAIGVFFSVLPTPKGSVHTVIHQATVFNGEQWLTNTDIVFSQGLIVEVGQGLLASYPNATIIDAQSKYIIPGLIDAHTHAWDNALSQAVKYGVTTELDMFTNTIFAISQRPKRDEHQRDVQQADLFSAGTLVTSPDGHGTEYGFTIATISSPEQAQAFVDARIAEGSDYIKIVYDVKRRHRPSISKDTLTAVIEATHQKNLLAVVHIGDYQSALDAANAGADGLVHGFMDDVDLQPLLAAMNDRQQFIIPTLSILASMAGQQTTQSVINDFSAKPRFNTASIKEQLTTIRSTQPHVQAFQQAKDNVGAFANAGVLILAGTDAPNPGTAHGISLHNELALLVDSGLTPTQAIQAATSNVALAFNLKNRGYLKPQMKADFIVLNENPALDITNTRSIAAIYKNGFIVRYNDDEKKSSLVDPNTMISNFDNDLSSSFNAMWQHTTDQRFGGDSTISLIRADDAQRDGNVYLSLTGSVGQKLGYAWAGAYLPLSIDAKQTFDFSNISSVTLNAKGSAGNYRLLIFSNKQPMRPIEVSFSVSTQWQKIEIPINQLSPALLGSVTAIALVAGKPLNDFSLNIDDVWLN